MKYTKKKSWDRYRPEFLKIGLSIAIGLCLMAFNYTSYRPIETYDIEIDEYFGVDMLITPPVTMHIKKKTPMPKPKVEKIIKKFVIQQPIITDEPFVIEETIEESTQLEELFGNTTESTPIVAPIIEEPIVEEAPLLMADRMPVYKSCDIDADEMDRRACTSEKILQHTYANIKYPSIARENEIEGMVVVSFVVDKNGVIQDIKILRDIGGGCGAVVEKAIKKMGNFFPAKHNGRPVSIVYKLPIKFSLQ